MTLHLTTADRLVADKIARALLWRGDAGDDLAADALYALIRPDDPCQPSAVNTVPASEAGPNAPTH